MEMYSNSSDNDGYIKQAQRSTPMHLRIEKAPACRASASILPIRDAAVTSACPAKLNPDVKAGTTRHHPAPPKTQRPLSPNQRRHVSRAS